MVGPDFWWAPVTSDRVSVSLSAEPQLSYFRCWKRMLNPQDGWKEKRKTLKYLWSLASNQGSLAISGRGEVWINCPSRRHYSSSQVFCGEGKVTMGENRKGSWFSPSERRLAFNIGPTWQNHPMKSVHSGGIQQCLFLLAPHLWFSNMSGDIVKLQKKGAEVFWGFLASFWHIAIEGLSDERVMEALTSQRKRSRSSSNPGNSCKMLWTILYRKTSISLSIVA